MKIQPIIIPLLLLILVLPSSAGHSWDITTTDSGEENGEHNRYAYHNDGITGSFVETPKGDEDDDKDKDDDLPGTVTLITSPEEGTVLTETTITADDGIATLTLPEGTAALDGDGEPLTRIGIEAANASEISPVPDNATFTFASYAYECSPSGATFTPAITLNFTLPAEEWETLDGDYTVRFYDNETDRWVEVPVTVDAASRTVTAEVAHFSVFALYVEADSVGAPAAKDTLATPLNATAEETSGGKEAAGQEPTTIPESPLVFAPVAALGALLLLGKRR
jgi:hypothetical protein